MSMTPERLQAIRARCEQATPGPWSWAPGYVLVSARGDRILVLDYTYGPRQLTEADAEFVAHAREDVPALLEEVERLQAEVRALRRRLRELREQLAMYELSTAI